MNQSKKNNWSKLLQHKSQRKKLHQHKRKEEALHVPSQKKADQKSDHQNTPLRKKDLIEDLEVAVIHLIQIDQENDQLRRDDPPQKNENLTIDELCRLINE